MLQARDPNEIARIVDDGAAELLDFGFLGGLEDVRGVLFDDMMLFVTEKVLRRPALQFLERLGWIDARAQAEGIATSKSDLVAANALGCEPERFQLRKCPHGRVLPLVHLSRKMRT